MLTEILTSIMLIIFFAVMIGIGLHCRRHATDVNGFVLGGRSVGPWLTAFAFGTSYFSAVIFVGYAGQFGWNFGLASTWIGLGNAFIGSLLPWVILGRRTRLMTQQIESKTMPDFFAKRYGSPVLKTLASVIVFVFLIPYTASLYNGLSSLFNIAFDIPYVVVIIAMSVLTGVYVIFGGYMATAINDFIQGIIMLVGIVCVVAAVLNANGGFTEAVISLSQIPAENSGLSGAFTSFFGPQPVFLVVVVLLTSLGTWGLPQMVGKFYSITNEDAVKKGTIISTVFALIVAGGCYFLGGFARLYDVPSIRGEGGAVMFDKIIPTMLANMPALIVAIVIVLVLSASMSTLSSLVLTSASTITLDVVMKGDGSDEKKKVFVMRLFIVFFIAVSAVLAYLKDTYNFSMIAQMMGVSWGALAGSFLAPFLYGLYWKRTTAASVVVSFAQGVVFTVVMFLKSMNVITLPADGVIGFIFKTSLHCGVFTMLLGLVLVPVVSLLTGKPDASRVDEIFDCYNRTVIVNAKNAIGEEIKK